MSRKSKKQKQPQRPHTPAPPRPPTSPLIWLARICFVAATAVAAYLLFYSITEKPMAGCGPGSPCDRVMGSAWAYWLNIPVSGPALGTYLLLLGCAVAALECPERSAKAWNIGLVLSIFVTATALWFVFL